MRLLAMQKSSALTGVIMAAVALVLLLPVISVGLALFNSAPWSSISSNYLGNTLLLMAMVGALTALIGVSCAWLVTIYDFPGRRWLSWALVLPIAIPAYINAYTYADLLEFYGPVQSFIRSSFGYEYQDYWFPSIRNLPGAAITLSLVLYPYVYLLSRAAFLNQSQSQWWAARSLGASSSAAFFKIALPSARPAIAGGVALVLMETGHIIQVGRPSEIYHSPKSLSVARLTSDGTAIRAHIKDRKVISDIGAWPMDCLTSQAGIVSGPEVNLFIRPKGLTPIKVKNESGLLIKDVRNTGQVQFLTLETAKGSNYSVQVDIMPEWTAGQSVDLVPRTKSIVAFPR